MLNRKIAFQIFFMTLFSLFSCCILPMDGQRDMISRANIMTAIKNCCEGEIELTGRSELSDRIKRFKTSTDRMLEIPNLPVITDSQRLVLTNVTFIKLQDGRR